MDMSQGSRRVRRAGAVLAAMSMMAAGAAIAAAPATAAGGGGDCPAADQSPPSPNTYYARDGVSIRGVRVRSTETVGYGYNTRRLVHYTTTQDTYVQNEVWDLTDRLMPRRVECVRDDTDGTPDVEVAPVTSGGGGGGRTGSLGSGSVGWRVLPGAEEVRYGKVGEIQSM
ncbi:hypothetical protein AB4028_00860 [Janibacter sp. RAF20_2_2]|uniref:hypothetical protein n=1 Tax=Janibacter TaxID=53457 RepID=UPI0022370795|nr:hypothetical protein [Janibacter hoylei]MCW4601579.1 hypothetical protein [Janibacter hoylei]